MSLLFSLFSQSVSTCWYTDIFPLIHKMSLASEERKEDDVKEREGLANLKASSFMHGKGTWEFWSWKHLALLLPPRDQINEIYALSTLPHTHSYTSFNFSFLFRHIRKIAYIHPTMHTSDTYFVFEHINSKMWYSVTIWKSFSITFFLFRRKKTDNILASFILFRSYCFLM